MTTAPRPLRELLLLAAFAFALMAAGALVLNPPWAPLRPLVVATCALPAPFLAARAAGRDFRWVLSVAGRVRWGVLGPSLTVAAAVYGALGLWRVAQGHGDVDKQLLVLALAVVPAQAAAEEAVFRGALPQIVGAWVRAPWAAYGLPALMFALLHGDVTGALVFGACASAMAWFTGGIEAPFALHVGANYAFYLPLLAGAPAHLGPDTLAVLVAAAGTALWLFASRRFTTAPSATPRP